MEFLGQHQDWTSHKLLWGCVEGSQRKENCNFKDTPQPCKERYVQPYFPPFSMGGNQWFKSSGDFDCLEPRCDL
ncbi:hypothetical protein GE061_015196 [Apolygus lucorum]|uniref:Uncharacterized protein n=1 Tax=Apolygus lucorum TaxID=248454 RepID=A0A8S9XLE4_APOLU|nr:hypothetical protein GE061_015196 [Apolygus lucorum]